MRADEERGLDSGLPSASGQEMLSKPHSGGLADDVLELAVLNKCLEALRSRRWLEVGKPNTRCLCRYSEESVLCGSLCFYPFVRRTSHFLDWFGIESYNGWRPGGMAAIANNSTAQRLRGVA